MSSWRSPLKVNRPKIILPPTIVSPASEYNTISDNIISVIVVADENCFNTLDSILNQLDRNFVCLIVITPITPNSIEEFKKYDKILFKIVDCRHEINNINFYRDYGASYAYTDWITFINSGDTIHNNTIGMLRNNIHHNTSKDCVFYNNKKYFCFKTILFYDNYKFNNNDSLLVKLMNRPYLSL